MSANPDSAERGGCPTAEELAAFGVGRLPDGALEAVAAHLEGCAACRALLSALDGRPDPLEQELRRPLPPGLLSGGGGTPEPTAGDTAGYPAARTVDGLPAVPGYEVLDELGRGGMGVVYRAWQPGPNRLVALKMLRAGDDAGPAELARFRTEAEAVGRLRHPHVAQIYEVGEHQGRPYLALERSEERRVG